LPIHKNHLSVLIITDHTDHAQVWTAPFRKPGYDVDVIRPAVGSDLSEVVELDLDLILVELSLTGQEIESMLQALEVRGMEVPVVIMADPEREIEAIEWVKKGAFDYVCLNQLARLDLLMHQTIEKKQSRMRRWRFSEQVPYQQLIDRAGDILLVIRTSDGQILEANHAAEQIYGYSRHKLLNMKISELRSPDTHGKLKEQLQKAYAEGITFEVTHVRKNGTQFPVEVSSRGIHWNGGHYTLSVIRDITDRKQAEIALLESEQKYRAFIKQNSEGVVLVDEQGIIVEWNQAQERISGILGSEAIGEALWDIQLRMLPPDRRTRATYEAIKDTVLRELTFGRSPAFYQPIDVSVTRPDGAQTFIRQTVFPIKTQLGYRLGSIAYDITEHKIAEKALWEKARLEERLSKTADTVPGGLFTLLQRTDGATCIPYVSSAWEEIHGIRGDEVKTDLSALERVIQPDDFVRINSSMDFSIQTMTPWRDEYRILHPDRGEIWVEGHSAPLREPDGSVSCHGFISDITDRKRAEEQLRQTTHWLEESQRIAQVGGWALDLNTNLGWCSPEACQIYGLPAEEFTIAAIQPIPLPQFRGLLDQTLKGLIEGTGKYDIEFRITNQVDGTIRDVHSVAEYDPITRRVFGALQDTTEQKRAGEHLRKSEERYRLLFENLLGGFAYCQMLFEDDQPTDYIYLNVNDKFEVLTGLKNVVGKKATDIFPEIRETNLEAFEIYGRVARSGEPERFEGYFAGINAWLSISVYSTEVGTFITLFENITERKQADEVLRQRLVEAEALFAVSSGFRMAQTLDEALPILLDQALIALDGCEGSIWLDQPPAGDLHLAVGRGWINQLGGVCIQPDQGIIGRVFSSGQAMHLPDVSADPLAGYAGGGHTPCGQTALCVPIRMADDIIGVMMITAQSTRQLSEDQVRLVVSLTEMAGVALHRIRLYEDTTHHLEQLKALRAIDQAILSSQDLHRTLDVLLGKIIDTLQVDAADVLLYHPETQTLQAAAANGLPPLHWEQSLSLGESHAGQVALSRRLEFLADISQMDDNLIRKIHESGEPFTSFAAVPLVAKGELKGVLELFHRTRLEPDGDWMNFLAALGDQAAIAIDSALLFNEQQQTNTHLTQAYEDTIDGWSRALDLRDKETEGHSQRVTDLTMDLARRFEVSADQLVHLRRGAKLHDIGKMGIPDNILLKPGKLTTEEWEIMRLHPVYASDLLSQIEFLAPALDIPQYHHEKWDGSGYPRGLKGEEIPFAARIFTVVDVWDALTSDRPYRKAWSRKKTREYIQEQSGIMFDPMVVKVFLAMVEQEHLSEMET
jgi:PAS domain S-box-containing protein